MASDCRRDRPVDAAATRSGGDRTIDGDRRDDGSPIDAVGSRPDWGDRTMCSPSSSVPGTSTPAGSQTCGRRSQRWSPAAITAVEERTHLTDLPGRRWTVHHRPSRSRRLSGARRSRDGRVDQVGDGAGYLKPPDSDGPGHAAADGISSTAGPPPTMDVREAAAEESSTACPARLAVDVDHPGRRPWGRTRHLGAISPARRPPRRRHRPSPEHGRADQRSPVPRRSLSRARRAARPLHGSPARAAGPRSVPMGPDWPSPRRTSARRPQAATGRLMPARRLIDDERADVDRLLDGSPRSRS
jgi:hypothetical protein